MGKEYLYLCDGKACGEVCPQADEQYPFKCRHTSKKEHSATLQSGKVPVFAMYADYKDTDIAVYYEIEEKGEKND